MYARPPARPSVRPSEHASVRSIVRLFARSTVRMLDRSTVRASVQPPERVFDRLFEWGRVPADRFPPESYIATHVRSDNLVVVRTNRGVKRHLSAMLSDAVPSVNDEKVYDPKNARRTKFEIARYTLASRAAIGSSQFVTFAGPDCSKIGTSLSLEAAVIGDQVTEICAVAHPQVMFLCWNAVGCAQELGFAQLTKSHALHIAWLYHDPNLCAESYVRTHACDHGYVCDQCLHVCGCVCVYVCVRVCVCVCASVCACI